ncbi:TIGR03745 family integrating conjugative element membrane protein [Endozoicomonas sp. ALC066]|uniref:TIGR03745 family integrating conjugative element membrane protein n=1 Tax=Endozoicomonas sp. ALC066 TaxID=3403078 RepID=UPI003BB639B9
MKIKKYLKRGVEALTGSFLWIQSSFAALPDVSDPTNDVEDGNYLGLAQAYGFDFVALLVLVVASVGFLTVASNVISSYREVQTGKKTWTELGIQFVVGCLLLVFIIFLMTEVSGILDD